jgi:hypothetical protein
MKESSSTDYEALLELRVKHSRMFKLFILVFVMVFGGLLLFFLVPSPLGDWFALLPNIGMILAAIMIILSYPFGRTPCPRCGKPYYVKSGFWGFLCSVNLSYRKCVHCELPLNATEEEFVEQSPGGDVQKAAPEE